MGHSEIMLALVARRGPALSPRTPPASALSVCMQGVRATLCTEASYSRRRLRRIRDRIRILAAGGEGGAGCASRFSDTLVECGPANGGSGGQGGDVLIRASHNKSDLHLPSRNFRAESGIRGQGDDMHGRRGKALEIVVPCGTTIHRLGEVTFSRISRMASVDEEQIFVAELLEDGDSIVVARGGAGGRGNAAFRTELRQHSKLAEDGGPGEAVTLVLSLKLIADAGLVGFPNAGKSSILRALSNATPEVASYPFTTVHPYLGRVRASAHEEFTLADVPGLVEGAHANRGMGHSFLRHIERTSLLCYVLDLASAEPPFAQLSALISELELYQPGLSQRPCMLIGNKADADGAAEALHGLRRSVARLHASGGLPGLLGDGDGAATGEAPAAPVVTPVSALHGKNLPRLVARMHAGVAEARRRLREQEVESEALQRQAVQVAEHHWEEERAAAARANRRAESSGRTHVRSEDLMTREERAHMLDTRLRDIDD